MKAAALALSILILGQTTPTFLETLEVEITNLDVVVTDRGGHPVTGLTRGDFQVRENGAPQPITNFAEYRGSKAVAEAVGETPATSTAAPPSRKFLFFIDEMSLNMKTRVQLLDRAAALVRDEMRPGDEAMIVTPATAEKVALAFTSDRAAVEKVLRQTIEQQAALRANTRSRSEQLFLTNVVMKAAIPREYEHLARIYATRVNRRVTSTLRTLLGLVGSLNQTSGRKIVVVIGDSLVSQPGFEAYGLSTKRAGISPPTIVSFAEAASSGADPAMDASMPGAQSFFDVRPMIDELTSRASANGITIYSLQPEIGVAISAPGDVSVKQPPRSDFAIAQWQRDIIEGTGETLRTLAEGTGGRFVIGDVGKGFREIENDLAAYYSIGYRTAGGTSSIRSVDVRVKNRPELTVRTRREMLRRTPEKEMDEMVAANLITPRDINELGITTSAGAPQRGVDSYRIDVVVKIPLSKLTFIPEEKMYRAHFSVHYAASDGADYTTGQYREQTVQASAADIDAVRAKTYTYTTTLVVAPGTARISVGVLDAYSRLSGFQRLQVVAR